jgi:hypothetical protein
MEKQHRKLWDLRCFDAINLPEVIGTVTPQPFSLPNGIRVLDLPLHLPEQGWRIPGYLKQFHDVIALAQLSEQKYGDLKNLFCYITVDQKPIAAGKTQRRAGAHSDAYIEAHGVQVDVTEQNRDILLAEVGEVSHTYLCYDALPTEFFQARFPLHEPECQEAMQTFDQIASVSPIVTYPAYTVLRLDPYVVHRAAVAQNDTTRTFVKISFSRKRYNRAGNSINSLFTYNWDFVPRDNYRNHPWG